jgi:hypothetical protein
MTIGQLREWAERIPDSYTVEVYDTNSDERFCGWHGLENGPDRLRAVRPNGFEKDVIQYVPLYLRLSGKPRPDSKE